MRSSISWLHKALGRRSVSRSPRRSGQTARPRSRPSLDCLEERWLLATLIVTRLTDTSAASSPGELRTAIAKAAPADTIIFQKGLSGTIALNASLGLLTINQDLTILGGGVITLSGQNATPVLVNNSSFATLSGLTITGASNLGINAEGGAIYNRGELLLQSSTLSGNTASFGGGIYNHSGGKLYLSNSTLSGNSAPRGGGGIYNRYGGKVTLTNCILSGNTAGSNFGGGIFNGGKLTVQNSTLSGNTAGAGGGVYNGEYATATVQGGTLSRNRARNTDSGASEGGGIENKSDETSGLTVSNCTLSNNSATMNGGGINQAGVKGTANVVNSVLTGNQSGNGGGIASVGTLTVQNSTLSGNVAASEGGAIYGYGQTNVEHSTLNGNRARSGGGIFLLSGSPFDPSNFDEQLVVVDSTLSRNSATSKGGGIYMRGGGLTLQNSTLSGNQSRSGGGIYNNYAGGLFLKNSTLSGNAATSKGGGIFSYYNLTRVFLSNTIIAKNVAPRGPDLDAPVVSQGHNLIGNGSSTFHTIINGVNGDRVGTSASPIDPKLGPLRNNGGPTRTRLPLPGSPALGNGGKPLASTDQRGVAYPPNGPWDIGSVQVSTTLRAHPRPRRRG